MSVFTATITYLSTLGHFWEKKINASFLRWNLLFISISLIYLTARFGQLPPQIPLFYSLVWGETQLASAAGLFLLPTLSIVVALLNHFLAAFLLKGSTLLSRLLIIFSLVFSVLSTIALFRIINLIL